MSSSPAMVINSARRTFAMLTTTKVPNSLHDQHGNGLCASGLVSLCCSRSGLTDTAAIRITAILDGYGQARWMATMTDGQRPAYPGELHYHLGLEAYQSLLTRFTAAGVDVGVKASNKGTPDVALVASTEPCAAAAVFTKNAFQATPVTVSRDVLERRAGKGASWSSTRAAPTPSRAGAGTADDAVAMGREVDRCFGNEHAASTLVMSTGVIGQR